MSDYKATLRLPETAFPMKANLKEREPAMLKRWEEMDAYGLMLAANQGRPDYVLHDGPPYANGNIHMGTAMNKVLKDMIVKSRNMQGLQAGYVPGWDCHGLPIEHKVELELKKKKKELPAQVIRKLCREYAAKWLSVQRAEFKRLGVFGVWDKPYMTMAPIYDAATARELGRFMAKGGALVLLLPHGPGRGRGGIRGPHLALGVRALPAHGPQGARGLPHGRPGPDLRRHLDHHALDPAVQHGRGRASGIRLRPG
jgi:isoleucyl-tRNA synthetase